MLKSRDSELEVLYIGQKGSIEAKIARAAGLEFAEISAGKLRRFHNAKLLQKLTDVGTLASNTRDLSRVVHGLTQSLKIIRTYQPDIIFLKGGYVTLPVGLAAGILKVPYVIHESDMRPGLTNRILSRRAQAVAVGFPVDKYQEIPKEKLVYTGNPLRQDVLSAHRLEGLAHFKLSGDLPVILITGGSQGAAAINEAVMASLPELTQRYQVIHVTGERNIEHVRFEFKRLKLEHTERYLAFSFLSDDMGLALAAADLVIGRGGANTFSELAALGKPALIIPHPGLEDQMVNTKALARLGAIKVIQQDRLTKSALIAQVDQILGSEKEQSMLTEAIKAFAVTDADQRLADLILENVPSRPVEETDDGSA